MKEVYTLADLRNWEGARPAQGVPVRVGVFGDPVAHSLSPQMHNPALAAGGIAARYARFQIAQDELAEALRRLPGLGFIGMNLTVPHKAAALALMDDVDGPARSLGAINTVVVAGNRLRGFNTDGYGIARAIEAEFGRELRELRVLVLGAGGGAGRAIARQCVLEKCPQLFLVNRTLDKATHLHAELTHAENATAIAAVPWSDAALPDALRQTDLVINATSSGLKPDDPPLLDAAWWQARHLVYDTIYNPARTALLRDAAAAGARVANGLSMLLHQGARSFEIWFDRPAPLAEMRARLAAAADDVSP